ncbi:hypothetical protein PybrP1_011271 [[Pythium] brassicae (nom. inval.)]|nr:hypothetical protein PybrP1_011271 [[Pythium] brassicae (nom. inval.)]
MRGLLLLLLPTLTVSSPGGAASAATVGTFDATHCARCEGLRYCSAMNGKLLFDPVYGYTRHILPARLHAHREATAQLEKQGVCEDLDAKTLAFSRFGDEMQFKDTPACQQLVWNYHCLSWVAAIFQRRIDGVSVACVNADASATLPLPPCRSLCVEVADKCVHSHFYRTYLESVCGNVPCVTEEQELLSANSSAPLKQRACVKAPWESVPNTTFSRCSIRAYEPPKAGASRLAIAPSSFPLLLLGVHTAMLTYSAFE